MFGLEHENWPGKHVVCSLYRMVRGRFEDIPVLLLKSTLGCAFGFTCYGHYMGGRGMVGIAMGAVFFPLCLWCFTTNCSRSAGLSPSRGSALLFRGFGSWSPAPPLCRVLAAMSWRTGEVVDGNEEVVDGLRNVVGRVLLRALLCRFAIALLRGGRTHWKFPIRTLLPPPRQSCFCYLDLRGQTVCWGCFSRMGDVQQSKIIIQGRPMKATLFDALILTPVSGAIGCRFSKNWSLSAPNRSVN